MQIEKQQHLSQYEQISTFVYHVLAPAIAGGLDSKKAEKMYYQILDGYSELSGEAFYQFRDEIIRILVTPDDMFDGGECRAGPSRWN